MITVANVVDGLDRWAPFSSAAVWDPVGLQVGAGDAPVAQIGVCHEINNRVVDAAVDESVDLLVTYHPLLFRPIDRIVDGPGPAGLAVRLVRNGVSVIAAHTNVDVAPGGMADSLAEALGLQRVAEFGGLEARPTIKVVVFVPGEAAGRVRTAMASRGAGTIGLYRSCSFESAGVGRFEADSESDPAVGTAGTDNEAPELRLEMVAPADREQAILEAVAEAHPYEEPAVDVYDVRSRTRSIGRVGELATVTEFDDLAAQVAAALDDPPLRLAPGPVSSVRRVAVVPGAGSDFASAARAAGADVLVTGDARHHATVAANRAGLGVIDATHEGTERPGMQALYRAVSKMAPTVDLTAIQTNPWTVR